MSFDGNDYRKRVLAAIEARGGLQATDPFEYYDLPLEDLRDAVVAAQVDAVWAFWQKSRDSPKYRGLVTALLEEHREVAPLMLERGSRRQLADQVRALRAERDTGRFAELDAAVERLVERFGGIPTGKLEGLRRLAAEAGLDAAAVEERLRRVPLVETRSAPTAAALPAEVRRQVRADLDELGRLLGTPPPATLYDLLGLTPGATPAEVAQAREVAAARNRELRPDRRRALVDDLLAAVFRLLLDGEPAAYLDAVAEDVTAQLRPRVAAAVLVEDVLTPDDLAHLLGEAQAAGLDRARAERVLAALATEAGVPVPAASAAAPLRPRSGDGLSEARAALRAGRVLEAQRLVEQARRGARGTTPPLRAVADEVSAVLAEAAEQWRAVEQALAARRFTEAATALERLVHIAADVPGPRGLTAQSALAQARAGLEAAAARLESAQALAGAERERALLSAAQEFPDSEPLLRAVRDLALPPPTSVQAQRTPGGVLVRWRPSSASGVEYRVLRVSPDGSRRVLATTRGTELEDGEPPSGQVPTYVVVARRAGVLSPEAVSGAAPAPGPAPAPAAVLPPPVGELAAAALGRRLRLTFAPPATGTAQVRRLEGAAPPAPGTPVPDPDRLGLLVPGMGPGLAVDPRPRTPTSYVVVTVGGGAAVAGGSVAVADVPAVRAVQLVGDRLRWQWPAGCTEALVVWRPDAPPEGPHDVRAQRRKVTNTRYDLDGGAALPEERPLHVAVFGCVRHAGALVPGLDADASARLHVGPSS